VTPDIIWTGGGLPNYDPANSTLFAIETQMNAKLDSMRAAYGEHMCGEH
jgi:hypothetical protein